jgi:hypothetical protein
MGGLVAVDRTWTTNIDVTPIRFRCNGQSISLLINPANAKPHPVDITMPFHKDGIFVF